MSDSNAATDRRTVHTPPSWSDQHREKFLAWLNDELDKDEDRKVTREFLSPKLPETSK